MVVENNLEAPLTGPGKKGDESLLKKVQKGCCGQDGQSVGKKVGKGCCGCLAVTFILMWALQGLIYWFTTSLAGCSAGALSNYDYPGGGTSDAGGAVFNLVPRISLLVERPTTSYGDAFDVIPSNEASTINAAPAGAWYRTWGPIYYTYTYEDVANSKTTAYMRANLLRLGQSHRIERCDGQGPDVWFEEGTNYFSNRLRRLFSMNQAYTFKIYQNGELVVLAEETGMASGFPSMSFRNITTNKMQASSVLKDRSFHGKYDEWLVSNHESLTLPYYVTSAATMLFADSMGHIKKKEQIPQGFMELEESPTANSSQTK